MTARRVLAGTAFTFAFLGVLISMGVALAAAMASRSFPRLAGLSPSPSALAPRCYEVAWAQIDSVYAVWGRINGLARLPRELLLQKSPYARAASRGEPWLLISASDPDADSLTIQSAVHFAAWDIAGSDSIDVRLEVFPMTVQIRFPLRPTTARARALIGWDTPGTIPAEARVTRIKCARAESSRPTA
jgi:hypothetical protein